MALDLTKPAASDFLVSADVRANFSALAQAAGAMNLIADPTFLIWPAGDSSAPAHYTLTGASAAVARCGTGLGDTNRKVGKFCSKVTSGGAASAQLSQNLLSTSSYDDGFDNVVVAAGAWVKCSTGNAAQIQIADGANTSSSGFHSGGGGWEWLTVVRTIDPAATKIVGQLNVVAGTIAAYMSAPTFLAGPVPPQGFMFPNVSRRTATWISPGTLSTGTFVSGIRFDMPRPGIVLETRLRCGTAPTTQAIICDINKNNTSMYSTRPQIAASANTGSAAPDSATYSTRCFAAGDYLSVDIDQVGTGTAGADLTIEVVMLMFDRPQESMLVVGDVA